MERWEIIHKFLEVSNYGNVKSHGKFINGSIDNNGYKRVNVSTGGIPRKYSVHRLVAEAFLPNPKGYKIVNHLDGNKLNNHVDNLEWCNYSQNLMHAYDIGLRDCKGIKNHQNKLTELDVLEIRKNYKYHDKENNAKVLSKKYKVTPKTIYKIIKFETWKHI